MSTTAPPPTSADPTIDFVGLFSDQSEEVIFARMAEWANEGLDPVDDADEWVATDPLSHWYMAVMPAVREFARLYDLAGTEVPMSAMLLWAWGTYLDDLAATVDVERLPATAATGVLTFSGPAGTEIDLGTTVATTPAGADDPTPTFGVTLAGVIPDAGAGSGAIDLPITATDEGLAGNVGAGAITAQSTPLPAGVTFTNARPTFGGTDAQSDEGLRSRALAAIVGPGGANTAQYEKWASAWPGVGAVKVVPAPSGPNSVLVMITDPEGQPLPGSVVTAGQDDLDPVAGQGAGKAPVGARVDVETSVALNITVDATVTWKQGYSADGAGGTIAAGTEMADAVQEYMLLTPPGGTVRLTHVAGIIATWEGVENATGVTMNGAAADIAVGIAPPQSAQLVRPIVFH